MMQYSPYDNVAAQEYPHILITAGLNDTRVMYWEAAKWAAKLQRMKTDDNLLLLKTKMGSGHLGSSGRYDFLKDIAFEYAFLLHLFTIYE
jgi:oligopeptidase B